MPESTKNDASYERISGISQADGTSLETQRQFCLALASKEGYEVLPEHVYSEIASGADAGRPVLAKLLADAKDGKSKALFVYTSDRLSRDPVDLPALLRWFRIWKGRR